MKEYVEDNRFMLLALEQAKESVRQGGFPAGAIVVKDNQVIGTGISIGSQLSDPTSHGEMAAIRDACKALQVSDLSNATLYASMQPCLMCLGAAMWSTISKIVFAGAQDEVAPEYYGGFYNAAEINANFLHRIELVHNATFEEQSLAIVREWEEVTVASLHPSSSDTRPNPRELAP